MRYKLYQLINIAKNELQMSEDDYRALVKRITSHDSLKSCTYDDLQNVIKELEKKGFKIKPKAKINYSKTHGSKIHNKALSLWIQLAETGALRDRSDSAFNSYCKRFTKADHWRFMGNDEAATVIESLKDWIKRETTKNGSKETRSD